MKMRRALGGIGLLAGAVPSSLALVLATLATRPRLAAKVFGGPDNPHQHPSDFDLVSTDVEYAPGCDGWWIPAPDSTAAVVIVHGFETAEDPRAADPPPNFPLLWLLNNT